MIALGNALGVGDTVFLFEEFETIAHFVEMRDTTAIVETMSGKQVIILFGAGYTRISEGN